MNDKLKLWLKKEINGYCNCWNQAGAEALFRTCVENDYNKSECLNAIEDALWYNFEDFCRIHNGGKK